jgi:hypothetical protein
MISYVFQLDVYVYFEVMVGNWFPT